MTQEQKDLLLKDLCGRILYGVKISVDDNVEILQGINILDTVVEYGSFLSSDIEEVKPYLFPMSSMTDEQKEEYRELCDTNGWGFDAQDAYKLCNWLNKYHLDYNRLIDKGLAIDATGLNIY